MGWAIKCPSTIYAIRCIKNGRVYIGRTQDLKRRLREHTMELTNYVERNRYCGKVQHFKDDFKRYGINGFETYILEENVKPENAIDREVYWIAEYRATEPKYGYNKLKGKAAVSISNLKPGLPPKIEEVRKCRE